MKGTTGAAGGTPEGAEDGGTSGGTTPRATAGASQGMDEEAKPTQQEGWSVCVRKRLLVRIAGC